MELLVVAVAARVRKLCVASREGSVCVYVYVYVCE